MLSQESGLQERLEQSWIRRHEVLLHKDVPDIPPKPNDLPLPSDCFKLQWCVCGRDGSTLNAHRFHQKFIKLMKPHIVTPRQRKGDKKKVNPKTKQRVSLEECLLIARLEPDVVDVVAAPDLLPGMNSASIAWWQEAIQDTDGAQAPNSDAVTGVDLQPAWLHMSYVNFQTYEVSVLELQEDSGANTAHDRPTSQPRVRLKVVDPLNVCTLREFASKNELTEFMGR